MICLQVGCRGGVPPQGQEGCKGGVPPQGHCSSASTALLLCIASVANSLGLLPVALTVAAPPPLLPISLTVDDFLEPCSLSPRLRLAAVRTSDRRNSTLPRELCNGSTGAGLRSAWSSTGSFAAAVQGQRSEVQGALQPPVITEFIRALHQIGIPPSPRPTRAGRHRVALLILDALHLASQASMYSRIS